MSTSSTSSVSSSSRSRRSQLEILATERFTKTRIILGKGGFKVVLKGIDKHQGRAVAWCEIDLRVEQLNMSGLINEIKLLRELEHPRILLYISSWVNREEECVVIITECTSGSLTRFVREAGPLSIGVYKNWCRQILEGLAYLHTHEPKVIHRDIKCDNIFLNELSGDIKIGDFGLGTIIERQRIMSMVGTASHMAPESLSVSYDEKIDIWSFGMCIIEMVTGEELYSECDSPHQIPVLISRGKKPAAYYRISDNEVLSFVDLLLQTDPGKRPSASQLLSHPFLQNLDSEDNLRTVDLYSDSQLIPILKKKELAWERYEANLGSANAKRRHHPTSHSSESNDNTLQHQEEVLERRYKQDLSQLRKQHTEAELEREARKKLGMLPRPKRGEGNKNQNLEKFIDRALNSLAGTNEPPQLVPLDFLSPPVSRPPSEIHTPTTNHRHPHPHPHPHSGGHKSTKKPVVSSPRRPKAMTSPMPQSFTSKNPFLQDDDGDGVSDEKGDILTFVAGDHDGSASTSLSTPNSAGDRGNGRNSFTSPPTLHAPANTDPNGIPNFMDVNSNNGNVDLPNSGGNNHLSNYGNWLSE